MGKNKRDKEKSRMKRVGKIVSKERKKKRRTKRGTIAPSRCRKRRINRLE